MGRSVHASRRRLRPYPPLRPSFALARPFRMEEAPAKNVGAFARKEIGCAARNTRLGESALRGARWLHASPVAQCMCVEREGAMVTGVRDKLFGSSRQAGFTLVELLIVVL